MNLVGYFNKTGTLHLSSEVIEKWLRYPKLLRISIISTSNNVDQGEC